jgi:hypothetical protein
LFLSFLKVANKLNKNDLSNFRVVQDDEKNDNGANDNGDIHNDIKNIESRFVNFFCT